VFPRANGAIKRLLAGILACTLGTSVHAQCANATTNWDNLDYLVNTGYYAGFVTNTMLDNQRFTIGVNALLIQMAGGITTNGDNTTNTAEGGSFGAGADVQYAGTGTVTITFDTVVSNLQFSLYDIDLSQVAQVTAVDASGTPIALNITMTVVTAGIVTVTGNGTTVATATANGTSATNTDTRGTVNVSISGSSPATANGVKKVTITMSGTSGDFWLSDLTACVVGSFPTNYYAPLQPYTNQPAYYLVTPDNNSVYVFNPLTGVADWLFSEPSSPWVNSLAYDYHNHLIYYVMDHPTPLSTNKALKKYNLVTGTISTAIADVTTLGIPLYDYVVESAGAAYYNGDIYLGIEGTRGNRRSNRESIIWRIEFDASLNPVQASQVFGSPADNGFGTLLHDWADFTIKDGMLYDFNSGNQTTTTRFIHLNMQSGASTVYSPGSNPVPVQVGQTWDGNIYWTGGQSPELGKVALYNENGTIGSKIDVAVTICSPPWVGRAGDASDPFKPMGDFGDNPITYDPTGADPAIHEYDCNLRLGSLLDREWAKDTSFDATADGADEDGIDTLNLLPPGPSVNFDQDVDVYNSTGANATLIGWLDYDGDGTFESTEGVSVTVPPGATLQNVVLSWTGINVPMSAGNKTFIRLRLSSASNGMTVNDINGWFSNGEVEDYWVTVGDHLPVTLLSFDAQPVNNTVRLDWASASEINLYGYEVQRSGEGTAWETLTFVHAEDQAATYQSFDDFPLAGTGYYRLKMLDDDGTYAFSPVRTVKLNALPTVEIYPNPARNATGLTLTLTKDQTVTVHLMSQDGSRVKQLELPLTSGVHHISLDELDQVPRGVCVVRVVTSGGVVGKELVLD
jgi:hypothetical protein